MKRTIATSSSHRAALLALALGLLLALPASLPAANTKAASARSVRASLSNAASPPQDCSKRAARTVIPASSFGKAIKKKLRPWTEFGAGPILGYGLWKLICEDVTRDGQDEMIALLTCCTAATPMPWAIFERKADSWRPVYQVVSRKVTLSGLRVNHRGDVVEKLPRYAPDDAYCCPSAFSYRVTHWTGSRFVVRRKHR